MSNSDPSVIVLHGIPCIDGLYISFDSNREIGSLKVRRDSPFFFWRDRFSREHGQHAYRAVSDAERVASEASQSEERFTRKSNARHDAVQAGSDGAKGTFPDGQACRHEIARFRHGFYPGGHGRMWDLAESPVSIALLESFYNSGEPIALVCHSPGVLRHVTYQGAPLGVFDRRSPKPCELARRGESRLGA